MGKANKQEASLVIMQPGLLINVYGSEEGD